MIKIRWMGTPEDLKWFRKHLKEDKEIRLQNVSDRLPISTSNRYFRMMAEIEKIEDKELTTGQKKDRR
jgi:hypothetical protein